MTANTETTEVTDTETIDTHRVVAYAPGQNKILAITTLRRIEPWTLKSAQLAWMMPPFVVGTGSQEEAEAVRSLLADAGVAVEIQPLITK